MWTRLTTKPAPDPRFREAAAVCEAEDPVCTDLQSPAFPVEFRPYGESGAMVSDLFPLVGACADDLCFLKSVHGTNEAHGGALLKLHTGSDTFVRPSMGSWISYGLGSENRNLLLHHHQPHPRSWWRGQLVERLSSGGVPGTPLGGGVPIEKATIHYLHDPEENVPLQRAQLDFLAEVNRDHRARTGPDSALDARIESFELAFRMQTEAPKS